MTTSRTILKKTTSCPSAAWTAETKTKITLNVSGRRFVTWKHTLTRWPATLLGSKLLEQYYDEKSKEYFFDRDPHIFKYILNYYRSGILHASVDDCKSALCDELKYFLIEYDEDELIDECCSDLVKDVKCSWRHQHKIKTKSLSDFVTVQEKMWFIFDEPQNSLLGKFVLYFVGIFILTSIVATIVETVPCGDTQCGRTFSHEFFITDAVCVGMFTLEFVLRLLCCPNRLEFFKGAMNIIDMIAIFPFYLGLLLTLYANSHDTNLQSLVILRVFRVFRVLKLARHSDKLQTLASSLKSSATDIGFLVFAILMTVLVFATIVYFLELGAGHDTFGSIPDAMWYSVVTIITLGYGDVVPATIGGRITGSMCCIFGLFIVSLVVPVIQQKEKR